MRGDENDVVRVPQRRDNGGLELLRNRVSLAHELLRLLRLRDAEHAQRRNALVLLQCRHP